MKRIAILTSSRADYGIYLPLLKALKNDPFFELRIIAFGTHLSPFHGYTISQIVNDGFDVSYQIESMLAGDSSNVISTAMALTSLKFADFWRDHQHDFDLVLMDIHMPVMNGIVTTERIRLQAKYNNLPIIALSAGVTETERNNCIACGMVGFISKPINFEQLCSVIDLWLKPSS